MSYIIRTAIQQDLPAIQKIYTAEILHGFATWNDQIKDLTYFEQWLKNLTQHNYPVLVAVHQETQDIAGYADYAAFRNFSGYRHTVEHSIYIAPQYIRQGLGQRLLTTLIEHAKQNQVHVMIAAIDHANHASIALHQQLNFVQTGYMPEVGQKFGQWRDLVLLQLNL